jgi:hypothetical protein
LSEEFFARFRRRSEWKKQVDVGITLLPEIDSLPTNQKDAIAHLGQIKLELFPGRIRGSAGRPSKKKDKRRSLALHRRKISVAEQTGQTFVKGSKTFKLRVSDDTKEKANDELLDAIKSEDMAGLEEPSAGEEDEPEVDYDSFEVLESDRLVNAEEEDNDDGEDDGDDNYDDDDDNYRENSLEEEDHAQDEAALEEADIDWAHDSSDVPSPMLLCEKLVSNQKKRKPTSNRRCIACHRAGHTHRTCKKPDVEKLLAHCGVIEDLFDKSAIFDAIPVDGESLTNTTVKEKKPKRRRVKAAADELEVESDADEVPVIGFTKRRQALEESKSAPAREKRDREPVVIESTTTVCHVCERDPTGGENWRAFGKRCYCKKFRCISCSDTVCEECKSRRGTDSGPPPGFSAQILQQPPYIVCLAAQPSRSEPRTSATALSGSPS